MVLLRNFFQSVPEDLYEAASIDGETMLGYLVKILLPLSGAAIATVTLFYAVGYWNDYFKSLIYIRDNQLWPMQTVLRQVLQTEQFNTMMYDDSAQNLAAETLKDAMIVISVLPIPVSYTHLDVYKRQGYYVYARPDGNWYHLDSGCRGMENAVRVPLSLMVEIGREPCPDCCAGANMSVYVTKDVYKRQGHRRVARGHPQAFEDASCGQGIPAGTLWRGRGWRDDRDAEIAGVFALKNSKCPQIVHARFTAGHYTQKWRDGDEDENSVGGR